MNIKTTHAIRGALREHKPIAQEGMPYVRDMTKLSLPYLCKCGEGGQSYWNYSFTYSAWLDHFEVILLDTEVEE
jgi:hypothetical protein